MSTEERPAKRARDEDSEAPEITRSSNYWLEDGSIVLQAESTQFRIAKTTLANYSTVFRDMLSLPLPSDEPHVDGCPLAVLSGDSAMDWKYLLDAMHPKSVFVKQRPNIHQWAGVLRLSKKYDTSDFTKPCAELLASTFPTRLDQYDARLQIKAFSPGTETKTSFLAHAINAAREFGLWSVLPVAFYLLATSSNAKTTERANFAILNGADQVTCLEGYARLVDSYMDTPFKWMDRSTGCVPCAACPTPAACRDATAGTLIGLLQVTENISRIVVFAIALILFPHGRLVTTDLIPSHSSPQLQVLPLKRPPGPPPLATAAPAAVLDSTLRVNRAPSSESRLSEAANNPRPALLLSLHIHILATRFVLRGTVRDASAIKLRTYLLFPTHPPIHIPIPIPRIWSVFTFVSYPIVYSTYNSLFLFPFSYTLFSLTALANALFSLAALPGTGTPALPGTGTPALTGASCCVPAFSAWIRFASSWISTTCFDAFV
ncbi:BTB domain-containing protein [Mycena kentingensis (nom. inval.)]|nr:BTB domain-containing protein [Mycena kentingensis (nom. inval.)]